MTANFVTGLSPMQELKTSVAANVNPASGTDFSNVLKNSTSKEDTVSEPVKPPVKSEDKGKGQEAGITDPKEDVKAEKTDRADKAGKTDKATELKGEKVADNGTDKPISDEAMEEIAEAVATIVTTITEVLEIPAEEVAQAIEDIGLVDMELLNPNTIPNLVVELTDATDVTEIMTDEKLFADVKQIMSESEAVLTDVAKTLQIPVEELKGQIDAEVARLKEDVPVDAVDEDLTVGQQMTFKPEMTDEDELPVQEHISERRTDAKISVAQETDPQVRADDSEEIAPVSARHEDDKRQDAKNGGDRSEGHMNFTQTVTDTLKSMVADKVQETAPTYSTTAEQIMDQVRESLRMTMTEDVTEMEMNLHPASLGNVKVQVAAKDGVITASFTTENQQVKEVLEAQMIQLKDQMNEQGIKIEAVEVTVSAHAFERNLNEGGEERGGQSEAEAKKKKVRGINLTGGDLADIEELDEEDKVTADMMARQGNTVDYMA